MVYDSLASSLRIALSKGPTSVGASLPEDGNTTGFQKRHVFKKFRPSIKCKKKGRGVVLVSCVHLFYKTI